MSGGILALIIVLGSIGGLVAVGQASFWHREDEPHRRRAGGAI